MVTWIIIIPDAFGLVVCPQLYVYNVHAVSYSRALLGRWKFNACTTSHANPGRFLGQVTSQASWRRLQLSCISGRHFVLYDLSFFLQFDESDRVVGVYIGDGGRCLADVSVRGVEVYIAHGRRSLADIPPIAILSSYKRNVFLIFKLLNTGDKKMD